MATYNGQTTGTQAGDIAAGYIVNGTYLKAGSTYTPTAAPTSTTTTAPKTSSPTTSGGLPGLEGGAPLVNNQVSTGLPGLEGGTPLVNNQAPAAAPAAPAAPAPAPAPTGGLPGLEGGAPLVNGQVPGSNVLNASGASGTSKAPSNFESGFNAAKSSGAISPDSAGSAAELIKNSVPNTYDGTQADVVMKDNAAHQKYLDDFALSQSTQNQQQTLSQLYTQLSSQMGLPALNTQLMSMKNIMDGSEQDIRDEVTKAGGFATNSQVLALTDARNKTMIQNYNNLLQTRTDMQNNLTTMMGLAEQDRAYASAQIDRQLNFDIQESNYADKMLTNAQDSLSNTAKTMGWDGVLKAAQATGDPHAVARINSTMGAGFDLTTAAAKAAQETADAKFKASLDLQSTQADIKYKNAEVAKIFSDMKTSSSNAGFTVPVTNENGSTTYVPSDLAPYYNTSNSGVGYIDASTLQGTASEKTKLINMASKAGLKVITNKNTAADLVNIKDANSKLDTISTAMQNIGQSSWISRLAGGLGITWLQNATQSSPQKAAAGVLQSAGLDILKAISGVQGFRGNQTAIQQITDHLPKVTDTVDTINQKIAYVRQMLSDRENAAVGQPPQQSIDQVVGGVTYTQHADGLYYPK